MFGFIRFGWLNFCFPDYRVTSVILYDVLLSDVRTDRSGTRNAKKITTGKSPMSYDSTSGNQVMD
jgi:hypothetical protein